MKRMVSLVVVLAMVLSLSLAAIPVSALDTSNLYAVNTTTNNSAYALGPTFKMDKEVGMFAQTVTFPADVVGLAFGCWEAAKDGTSTVDISFYEYDTDLATSIAGTAEQTITVNVKEGQYGGGVSGYGEYDLNSKLPAGKYVVKFHNSTDTGLHLGLGTASIAVSGTYAENATSALGGNSAICMTFFTEKPEGIASTGDFVEGGTVNKLVRDIAGQFAPTSGTYVIDLAGYTWSNDATALVVDGTANVTVIDSVGGGKIYANNDAITPHGGSLTLRGISVEADSSGCDAVFAKGGTVVVEDCFLDGRQSSVHNDNEYGATVSVIGCTLDGDDVALKGRNNAVITISGNTVFNNTTVEMQRGFDSSRLVTDTFVAGEGCTITFDNPAAAGNGIRVNVTSYTGPVVAEDPAFAGATVEVDAGISLDFLVSDATEATEVKYNGVALPSAEYSEGVTKYTLSGFGPQEMGDDFTVELFVDGESVATLTYSVKKYCDAVLADDSASAELKTLVKEILNYGAKAQIYKNYKTDALVNAGNESTGIYRAPTDYALLKKTSIATTVNWKYATVNFADKIQLIFAFEGTVDKVKVFVGDKTYETTNFGTDAAGVSYVVFEDFTPADFRQKVAVQALNSSGTASRNLEYSVGSYVLFAAQSNDTAFANLAQALMIYGDAVAAYVASL